MRTMVRGQKVTAGVLISPESLTPNAKKILSASLLQDIAEFGIDQTDNKVFSESEMEGVRQEIKTSLNHIDQEVQNAYHNQLHAEEVAERVYELVDNLGLQVAKEDMQVLEIAGLFHDFQMNHPDMIRARGEVGLSAEEYSAIQADLFAKRHNLSIRQRILLQGFIMATSHGRNNIWPQTDLERVIALADIGGFSKPWPEFIKDCTGNILERPPQTRPQTLQAWVLDERAFLSYVSGLMKRMPTDWPEKCWIKELHQKELVLDTLLLDENNPAVQGEKRIIEASFVSFVHHEA